VGAEVVLAGFRVSDTSDYKKRGYVQIDDEWIRYRLSDDERLKGYMLFDGGGSSQGRATCDTQAQEHASGAKVIPVFSVRGESAATATLSPSLTTPKPVRAKHLCA